MKQKYSSLFVILTALNCVAMLVANIGAFKQTQFLQWSIPGGSLVFIITYVTSDIFSEVYGFKASQFVMWLGFALNAVCVVMLQIAIWLPAPVWFEGSEEFAMVLGNTPRVFVAGMVAFVGGSFMDDVVFDRFKRIHGAGNKFALRAIVSSFVGELLDSTIFTVLAFWGLWPAGEMLSSIITLVLAKTGYEVMVLPLTAFLAKRIRAYGLSVAEVPHA